MLSLGTERVKVAGGSPHPQPLIDSSESALHKLQRRSYQNATFHWGDQAIKLNKTTKDSSLKNTFDENATWLKGTYKPGTSQVNRRVVFIH